MVGSITPIYLSLRPLVDFRQLLHPIVTLSFLTQIVVKKSYDLLIV